MFVGLTRVSDCLSVAGWRSQAESNSCQLAGSVREAREPDRQSEDSGIAPSGLSVSTERQPLTNPSHVPTNITVDL